jgi:hypothetical protein
MARQARGRNGKMAMRRVLILVALLSGCGAVPDAGAEAACRSVFEAWAKAAASCGATPMMPDEDAVCHAAYSYDDDELNGNCLPWIHSGPCTELDNEHFRSHCGHALYLKTW